MPGKMILFSCIRINFVLKILKMKFDEIQLFELYLCRIIKNKSMKKIMRVLLLSIAFGFVVAACNNGKKEEDSSKQVEEQKEHATHDDTEVQDHGYEMAMTAYQCPMKCEEEKTYTEEGACPVCKMDLKEVEVASNEEAKEEEGVE